MTIARCPNCGKQRSVRAPSCPHCGHTSLEAARPAADAKGKEPNSGGARRFASRGIAIALLVTAVAGLAGVAIVRSAGKAVSPQSQTSPLPPPPPTANLAGAVVRDHGKADEAKPSTERCRDGGSQAPHAGAPLLKLDPNKVYALTRRGEFNAIFDLESSRQVGWVGRGLPSATIHPKTGAVVYSGNSNELVLLAREDPPDVQPPGPAANDEVYRAQKRVDNGACAAFYQLRAEDGRLFFKYGIDWSASPPAPAFWTDGSQKVPEPRESVTEAFFGYQGWVLLVDRRSSARVLGPELNTIAEYKVEPDEETLAARAVPDGFLLAIKDRQRRPRLVHLGAGIDGVFEPGKYPRETELGPNSFSYCALDGTSALYCPTNDDRGRAVTRFGLGEPEAKVVFRDPLLYRLFTGP